MTAAPSAPAFALVRAIPDSFDGALRTHDWALDPLRAREQHLAYVAALAASGCEITWLDADEACPDCCFVEDTAVVLGRHAVLTRPGAPSRRAEVEPVGLALSRWCAVHPMSAPATLDGGDVLRVGDVLFVGLSERTNEAGAAFLAEVSAYDNLRVVRVPVAAGLHLKSAVTVADAGAVILLGGSVSADPFTREGLSIIRVAEPAGGNVLHLGDRVLVSADAPDAALRLRDRGLDVHVLDMSELHKADGALTCLSLRVPRSSGWCC